MSHSLPENDPLRHCIEDISVPKQTFMCDPQNIYPFNYKKKYACI